MVHNAQWTTGYYASGSSHPTTTTNWSSFQNKLFEEALVLFPETTSDRWEKIASQIPGKSAAEVKQHYEDLIHDLIEIDAGRIQLPRYEDDSPSSRAAAKGREAERKKGVPWTEEEHRLFLIGLQRYGKGDWRSISRNAVVTRTPTQVASHAQKYFLRMNSMKEKKKRSSIHDITDPGSVGMGQVQPDNQVAEPIGSSFGYFDDQVQEDQGQGGSFGCLGVGAGFSM